MTFHNMFYLSFKEQLSYCIVKEMLLHSKTIAFETQNNAFIISIIYYHFLFSKELKILRFEISLQFSLGYLISIVEIFNDIPFLK